MTGVSDLRALLRRMNLRNCGTGAMCSSPFTPAKRSLPV